MAAKGFFILGTDTNVGKTIVAVNLLSTLKASGYSTIGLKPIASGAQQTRQGLQNADAISLQQTATISLSYEQVNPFCFAAATAPHIAASYQSYRLSLAEIIKKTQPVLNYTADYFVIEGVGGVLVPLNEQETMLDLVEALGFPVILVVGLRLGCLNHALLTYESLRMRNISIASCLCNQIDPDMLSREENIEALKQYIKVPFLTYIPHIQEKPRLKSLINIDWSSLIQLSPHVLPRE